MNQPSQNLPCTPISTGTTITTSAARSRHTGGVKCVLGDGSVKFVRDSITIANWRAASTVAGGEVLGDDW